MKGKVVLLGAGPGDPGLLTLRGRELLQAADTVVYDRLVSPELLELAPQARKIDVGKEQGRHPVPQEAINQILLEEAGKGGLVLRLKGGDPYLFGRGGEEAAYLEERGVSCREVPGVTSALAALASAGIPATYRGLSNSVHIITGHTRDNGALEIDFPALSRAGGTLIFLMAVSTMKAVTGGLLSAGMNPATPAAVVERGTCPGQRRITGTLATIGDLAEGVESPAILAVGEVCRLALGLAPLSGRTAVITRPAGRGADLAGALRQEGAGVFSLPCLELRSLVPGPLPLEGPGWLVLTSPESAARLFVLLEEQGLDARALGRMKLAVTGSGTGAELSRHGIRPDCWPEQWGGGALAQALLPRVKPEEPVWLLGASRLSPALPEALSAAGVSWKAIPLYETLPCCRPTEEVRSLLERGGADWVIFASGSAVEGFAAGFPELSPERFTAVCAGASAQAAAQTRGWRILPASSPSAADILDAIRP